MSKKKKSGLPRFKGLYDNYDPRRRYSLERLNRYPALYEELMDALMGKGFKKRARTEILLNRRLRQDRQNRKLSERSRGAVEKRQAGKKLKEILCRDLVHQLSLYDYGPRAAARKIEKYIRAGGLLDAKDRVGIRQIEDYIRPLLKNREPN